ncbi:MAG: bifunctional hydroxymethylpyrimidine kinase/phosphomethylpyrimidine kinase [Planctomycetes bacterium]|nr:bifunctional hydroxymethylpyrimidine kinase/phosphomethylpyrimidine kinase [Planctomycetota bacterium]MCB9909019.1 bifunctional hydroxymethylpyrimidine kinase/phosphomethylpyrimidine kinase [Planctomycetota bacterium]MCB9911736.1 bifunctional hydroxymethylpyrimidine kinase/phosphomethylpyrimidine kinase [Planctomycetota bacterium]
MTKPWVLAVGGVDPSGGAGLGADREAVETFGLDLVAIVTADTDQDDSGVRAVGEREPWRWLYEALASAAVENPCALKFGLLPSAEAIASALAVADQMRFDVPDLPIVLDPVMVSSSGFAFLDGPAQAALRAAMVRPWIWTPNLPEAAALLGWEPLDLEWSAALRLEAAEALLERGLAGVVLKDGHGAGETLQDLVWVRGGEPTTLSRRRERNAAGDATQRGTGCRFASALAANLGLGLDLVQAADRAGRWVGERIRAQGRAPGTA